MDINNPKILIIDDEQSICDACSQVFSQDGYLVESCFDGVSGLKKFDEFQPDIVFIDLKMPGMSGMEVLEKIRKKNESVVLIVITGYASIESAVESMKRGAFDFLPKPFTSGELRIITRRASEKRRFSLEADRVKQEKERMRQHFNFMVSHELRTPLVAVMQYLEVLTQGIAGVLSEKQKEIINRMNVRIKELLLLIERWLKLSMIEESNIRNQFKDFDLKSIIDDAIDLVKPLAQRTNITLKLNSVPYNIIIHGDKELIKEVFINLFNNGIKYNRKGGSVTVRQRQAEDFWVIDVIDTGVGIAENEIPNIMEEFYRVKQECKSSGAGLGLAIVKKILDIHDGKLVIESKLNQGSIFSVYLPRTSIKKGENS